MDLHTLAHDIHLVLNKGGHLPLFVGLFAIIRNHHSDLKDKLSDLGEVTGDNVLPKEILISLSSRRGL